MEARWEFKWENNKLYAFIVAILPCIMMYKVPIVDKGAATVIVLACGIVLLFTMHQIDGQNVKLLLPGIIYLIYSVSRSAGNTIEIILQISVFIHLYAICSNKMDIVACKKYIKTISMIASICVIVQYVAYLALNIHIPMIAYDYCLEDLQYYRYKFIPGMMYRPCAFFLEPSHMAQYLMLGLALCLLDKHTEYRKALIISLGMLSTTSGMGIVMLISIWGWFYFSQVHQNKKDKFRILFLGAMVALVVTSIAISIPGIQRILARIFGSFGNETSSYNAINGRLFWWDTYISSLKGPDLIYGRGSATLPENYLTGFMEVLYAYGIIGVFLYYNMLLYFLHKSNNALSSCIIILIGGLMYFANLTGFIYNIFYLGLILSSIKQNMSSVEETEPEVLNQKAFKYIKY